MLKYTSANTNTHTHTHTPLSGATRVSWYQKGKTNLDFTEARDSEWQWHQLSHMQVCTALQTDNHASTPPLKFFTGRMPFLPPNQQRQSTEWGKIKFCGMLATERGSVAFGAANTRHIFNFSIPCKVCVCTLFNTTEIINYWLEVHVVDGFGCGHF